MMEPSTLPETMVTAASVSTVPSNAAGMYIPTDPNSFLRRLESKTTRAVNRINLARQKHEGKFAYRMGKYSTEMFDAYVEHFRSIDPENMSTVHAKWSREAKEKEDVEKCLKNLDSDALFSLLLLSKRE